MAQARRPASPPEAAAPPVGAPQRPPWWRRTSGLAVVLLVAVAVRVAMLVSVQRSLYAGFLFADERTYDTWARALASGQAFQVFDQSSLPAYVMAAVYRLAGPVFWHVRLLNLALGVLTCALVHGIGHALRGPRAGLLAGLVAALYQPFAYFSVTLLKEPLGLLFFALTVHLFFRASGAAGRRGLWLTAAFGAAAAVTVNLRQNALVMVPILTAYLAWWAHRREGGPRAAVRVAGAALAGYAVLAAPFVALTYHETGQLSPTPVGGFNLYLGNNLESGVPFYRPVPFAGAPLEHAVHFTVEASRRVGRPLSGGEASTYWTHEVLRTALARPGAFARHLGWKALAVVNRWEEFDNGDLQFLAGSIGALRLPLLTFAMVLPLGLAGLFLLARRDPRIAALAVAALAYALTLVAVWPNARYRAPLVIILAAAGAAAVVELAADGARRRRAAALAAMAAAVAAIAWVPIPGAGDHTAAWNLHAMNLLKHGRRAEALELFERSTAAEGGYSAFALRGLAAVRLGEKDFAGARALLERIPDGSAAAAEKYELLGDLLMAEGRPREAVEAYERSLGVNSASRIVHYKLSAVLEEVAPGRVQAMGARLHGLATPPSPPVR